jgi:hypothetical protein
MIETLEVGCVGQGVQWLGELGRSRRGGGSFSITVSSAQQRARQGELRTVWSQRNSEMEGGTFPWQTGRPYFATVAVH